MVSQWTGAGSNNHFYEFVPGSFTWEEAKAGAASRINQGQTGYLVTITSAEESAFVNSLLGSDNAWIGASDATEEGVWKWETGPEIGNPATFTNWFTETGEPNGGVGENFAAVIGGTLSDGSTVFPFNGRWADESGVGPYGYIVEYNAPTPTPDPTPDPTPVPTPDPTPVPPGDLTAVDGYFNFIQFTRGAEFTGAPIPSTPVEVGGLQIPLLFDETYYEWKNPDVKAAVQSGQFASGYEHFVKFGQFEGRNPSTLYNEQYYLSTNADVAQAVQSGQFTSGLQHFLLYGNKEERNPSALFNQQDYLTGNSDVQTAVASGAFTSAFDHFIEYGAAEGRVPDLILFQEAFYLDQNPDVKAAVQSGAIANGYQHYLQFGASEGRNPSSLFSEQGYRSLNPDVAAAINSGGIVNGFAHYILFGREEGRPTQLV